VAGSEQRVGLEADSLERLAVAHTAGIAAVALGHPAMLPGQPLQMSPEQANLFICKWPRRCIVWVAERLDGFLRWEGETLAIEVLERLRDAQNRA
jgi:hypothetical protein